MRFPLLLAASLVAAMPAFAQGPDQAVAARVAALGRIGAASSPTLSPDGMRVAYLSTASGSPQIWIKDRRSGAERQLTSLPDPVAAVAWSPTADRIAYAVAPGGGLNTQIYVIDAAGGEAKRLTPGGRDNNGLFGWTRDGSALLADSNRDDPAVRASGTIDVETGAWRPLVKGAGITWISDLRGTRAVTGRLVGRGDNDGFLLDLATGRETPLTPHRGKAESGWGELSPDGRIVWLFSNVGRDRSAFGRIAIDAAGRPGPIRILAARDDAEAEGAVLSRDGRTAALAWNAGGRSELALLDTGSGRITPVPGLPLDLLYLGEFSADGRTLAVTGLAANRTTDVYTLDVATRALTRVTQSRHEGVELAALVRPELVTYAAPDGVPLSGWLYRPAGAAGPMPVVFHYHGGPEGQWRPTMSPDSQALVASGIAVFAPNVRGSSGYGKAFMAMDDGAKRIGSVSDIKATTDALVAKGIADPKRLGIMGGSYGGYMVMAALTGYPAMFAAGANLFGIVNFESFFRETEPWMAAISTTEYGDPVKDKAMLASLSPIHKLDRITTPLFVLHGANDTNVPVIEAEQIVASLRKRGVPVRYTLFPDEGHGWRKTANRVRSTTEIVAFFTEHLKP